MVRLGTLPNKDVIDGFKGSVDFYLYKDTAVARKWPRYAARMPHAAESANQTAFAYINKVAKDLPAYIIDQYKIMAAGTPFSWKDLLVRAYMKGLDY